MNIEQLKQVIAEKGTKIDTLPLTIEVKDNLQDLIDIFKANNLEIRKIELEFPEGVSLADRSTLVTKFKEILNHINGLKAFRLATPVKDYALRDLLNNKAILGLEELELTHRRVAEEANNTFINSKEFFETTLVSYLEQNKNLKELVIDDSHKDITALRYPNLKKALSEHPQLIKFDQGFLNWLAAGTILKEDPELISALRRKVQDTPAAKKARLETHFDYYTQQAFALDEALKTYIVLRKQVYPGENTWQKATYYLNGLLKFLNYLNKEYTKLNDGDETIPRKIALLDLLINYVALLKLATILQDKKATLNFSSAQTDVLEQFWDDTREELLKRIKNCKEGDYSALLRDIKKENQELTAIKSTLMPVVFPSSYKEVVVDGKDGLEKALRLLNDYTKSNSAISRFFHGHWNRHHVSAVNSILERIDSNTSVDELLIELNSINITNQNGSLARRIRYIEEHCQNLDGQSNKTAQSSI